MELLNDIWNFIKLTLLWTLIAYIFFETFHYDTMRLIEKIEKWFIALIKDLKKLKVY